jgi:hypothetical protein
MQLDGICPDRHFSTRQHSYKLRGTTEIKFDTEGKCGERRLGSENLEFIQPIDNLQQSSNMHLI